jgi:hypothetical protein
MIRLGDDGKFKDGSGRKLKEKRNQATTQESLGSGKSITVRGLL